MDDTRLTPEGRMHNSIALAAAQLRLAADLKRQRLEKYGKADENTVPFDLDSSTIFPQEPENSDMIFKNMQLGIGNKLKPSSLFQHRGSQVWKYGEFTRGAPNYMGRPWEDQEQTALCVPFESLKPGTGAMMEAVRRTMQNFYCHPEDRAVALQVTEMAEEDAWDGVCTTGFSIDGVPMHQPRLVPQIPSDPTIILSRMPVHTKMETNNNAKEGTPKIRFTFTVFGEEVHGFGTTKEMARRDGALKLCYMFQHGLDVHDFDFAFWHPLPSPAQRGARHKAEQELLNIVRTKMAQANPDEEEIAPRLFQASCTIEGLRIEAQAWSKRLAKKRLYLYLMLLMPNQLKMVDTTSWLGDGAGFAPDATYGLTDSQRGVKRTGQANGDGSTPKKSKYKPVNMLVTNEDEIRNKIDKHVTSFTKMVDGTGFPVNANNKKCMDFYLLHRCHGRHKFHRIDKKVNDKLVVTLELPDGTEYEGYGKYLDFAKHSALLTALKESEVMKTLEPMSTYGVCAYGLMQDIAQGVIVSVLPNSDSSIWTCTLTTVRMNTNGQTEQIEYVKSDFTKKGAQRIAAMEFLMKFNPLTKQAWKMAKEFANEKFRNYDGIDKTSLVNEIFQKFARKKPTKADSGLITWSIYGRESVLRATEDSEMNDTLIWEEIRSVFPYLTLSYDPSPVSRLASKLSLNSSIKDLAHKMMQWKIEKYDEEIKYFRVSLTLPSGDRYIGEGASVYNAQKNAAFNCLKHHPVLSIGDDGIDHRNYWSELTQRIGDAVCDLKSEIISGDADCPRTMYCRVRLTCFQNGEKLFESTATGISKVHADRRAAKKILEEPTYGAKPPAKVIAERNINISYIFENKQPGQIIQKCILKYKPGNEQPEQEYPAEGLNVKHAKAKAAYSFLCATFGPDQTKKQVREITSIKQVKPYNRNCELDPDYPPAVLERGNRAPDDLPDLNLEGQKKYDAMVERNNRYANRKKAIKLDDVKIVSAESELPTDTMETSQESL